MRGKIEIEQSIRDNLPIVFGKADSVDWTVFRAKYDQLVDYATAVSQPFLSAETVRYQSSLLYVSLIFISLNLFQLGSIKISENLLSVNRRLLIVYTIFIALLTLIFLIKAYVDTQRAHLVRRRNDQAYFELQQFMSVGRHKRLIQEYFWFEFFDVVGRTYKTYSDAASEAVNGSTAFEPIRMNAVNLDRDLLSRVPELANEIATQEKNLAALSAELEEDKSHFLEQATTILSEARLQSQDDPYIQLQSNSYERITKAYDEYLRNWFDAQNELTDEHLTQKLKEMTENPEILRLNAMTSVLKNTLTIRRIYAALEIVAPVVFALGTILYVWFRRA